VLVCHEDDRMENAKDLTEFFSFNWEPLGPFAVVRHRALVWSRVCAGTQLRIHAETWIDQQRDSRTFVACGRGDPQGDPVALLLRSEITKGEKARADVLEIAHNVCESIFDHTAQSTQQHGYRSGASAYRFMEIITLSFDKGQGIEGARKSCWSLRVDWRPLLYIEFAWSMRTVK
jgi:hypothetical protein